MNIGPTEGVPGAGRVERPRTERIPPRPAEVPPPAAAPTDRVEISETARLLSELRSMPEVRQDRVEDLRREIESGRYETPERLQQALENFIRENRADLDLLE